MPDKVFQAISQHIIQKLESSLSPRLTYHNIHHTFDVLEQAQRVAKGEGITDPDDLFIIKVAALYHDTGFIFTYKGHEEVSCQLAKEELPGYGLDENQIETICGMIRATKIPQTPHNRFEEILADADLDYLGREDFEVISNNLRLEFLEFGIVLNNLEWEVKQISFLESHNYFTATSRRTRNTPKTKQILKLKKEFEDHKIIP